MTLQPVTTLADLQEDRGLEGFGMEVQVDLGGCDLKILRSATDLRNWAQLLAEHIEMEPYGKPMMHLFGKGDLAGWTVIQLITTSNINLHAVPATATAYINVFSCMAFDAAAAVDFNVRYFGAKTCRHTVTLRSAPEVPDASA